MTSADLLLGCMYFGTRIDRDVAYRLLDIWVDAGQRHLDTANNYAYWVSGSRGGESESLLGDWLRDRGRRTDVEIATKVGARPMNPSDGFDRVDGLSAPAIRREIEESLIRLRVDVIDRVYAHIDDPATPIEETLGAFNNLVEDGLVRKIAVSNVRADRLQASLDISHARGWAAYDAYQGWYSLVPADLTADVSPRELVMHAVWDVLDAAHLPLVAYSPTLEGSLLRADGPLLTPFDSAANRDHRAKLHAAARERGVSVAQLAFAVLLAAGISPIVGNRVPEQLTDSLGAREISLTRAECDDLMLARMPGREVMR